MGVMGGMREFMSCLEYSRSPFAQEIRIDKSGSGKKLSEMIAPAFRSRLNDVPITSRFTFVIRDRLEIGDRSRIAAHRDPTSRNATLYTSERI